MSEQYLYGGKPADVKSANGVKGVLIRSFDGRMAFRVYDDQDKEEFADYEIRHDDLEVTIAKDELAAFYKVEENNIIDHSPEVLGLEKDMNR